MTRKDDIVGYIFDTLEPREEHRVEERAARDATLAAAIEEMRRVTVPLAEDDPIEPPLGLAGRAIEALRRRRPGTQESRPWSGGQASVRPLDVIVAATLFGIAGILVLPAIVRLRGEQSRIVCADRLRNLGMALALYAEQEGGHLPYVAPYGPMSNAGIFALHLRERDLLPDHRQLVCPSANNAVALVPPVDEYLREQEDPLTGAYLRRQMAGSYGYLLGYRDGATHRGFRPSDSPGRATLPILSDRPPRADEWTFTSSPNHANSGQNVLFADGHVRWLTDPLLAKDNLFRDAKGRVGAGLTADDIVIGASETTPYPPVEL